jgi:hypothetical protein
MMTNAASPIARLSHRPDAPATMPRLRGANWTARLLDEELSGQRFSIEIEDCDHCALVKAEIEMTHDGAWDIVKASRQEAFDADEERLWSHEAAALRECPTFALPVIAAGVGFLFPEVA